MGDAVMRFFMGDRGDDPRLTVTPVIGFNAGLGAQGRTAPVGCDDKRGGKAAPVGEINNRLFVPSAKQVMDKERSIAFKEGPSISEA